jgi:hypothetical protein
LFEQRLQLKLLQLLQSGQVTMQLPTNRVAWTKAMHVHADHLYPVSLPLPLCNDTNYTYYTGYDNNYTYKLVISSIGESR